VRLSASVVCALTLCLFLSNGVAWGDSVHVQNASFQDTSTSPLTSPCVGPETCLYNASPIPGWVITGVTGLFEPSSAYFNLPLPDSNILAYTNGGSISQTLTGVTLLPNSIYTLSVDVGRRKDVGELVASYSISLAAGSGFSCTTGGPIGNAGSGAFFDQILTCTTGATVPSDFLEIVLTGSGRQVDFDNVRLNVVSAPEPSALVLMLTGLGVVGLLFAHARRNRYLQSASS
jgi:hypothetical protein